MNRAPYDKLTKYYEKEKLSDVLAYILICLTVFVGLASILYLLIM